MQTILNGDDTLNQNQMAEILNVAQQTISHRLKAMGKIQKCGKWVPHELNERQMENPLLQFCFRHERKSILHRIVTGDEKYFFYFIISVLLSRKNAHLIPVYLIYRNI